jgi:hypothetical protein
MTKHGLAISVGLCAISMGCATEGQLRARLLQREEADFEFVHATLANGTRLRLPDDYADKVDRFLAGMLKDPESRRVTFSASRVGALACGTVNARNSYGGYVGTRPFAASFDRGGQIATLRIFSEDPLGGWYIGSDMDSQIIGIGCGVPSSHTTRYAQWDAAAHPASLRPEAADTAKQPAL